MKGNVVVVWWAGVVVVWWAGVVVVWWAGMLLGVAVRTGSPLNLSLAEPMWKQLAGISLSVTDLNEIDKDYVPGYCSCCCCLVDVVDILLV